jgi:hypothetical protein
MKEANQHVLDSIAEAVQKQSFLALNASIGIPTFLILSGVNMQDQSSTFYELGNTLRFKTPCEIAVLQSDKTGTVDLCLSSLFEQFSSSKCRQLVGGTSSMAILKSWYEDSCLETNSLLVVVFRDVEAFQTQVLVDLISVLSRNSRAFDKNGLPFVFLISVSTSQHTFHALLPTSCSNKLQVSFLGVSRRLPPPFVKSSILF